MCNECKLKLKGATKSRSNEHALNNQSTNYRRGQEYKQSAAFVFGIQMKHNITPMHITKMKLEKKMV